MPSKSTIACDLCGSTNLELIFSERKSARAYDSYHCRSCDLHQTLGTIDPISPDYIELRAVDLDEDHVYIQRRHKLTAFRQWRRTLGRHGIDDLSGLKILDIGCGVGGFLEYVRSQGAVCYGFDASQAHIEEARKTFENVRCTQDLNDYCDKLGIDFTFDLITMWDVF